MQNCLLAYRRALTLVLITSSLVYQDCSAQLPTFPGAEGYGKSSVGGRGGSVYEVTTLNPTGPGSLGEAIAASGPRTVVFRVSGTIDGNFEIDNDNITIAGQTAPGDGITIKGSLGIGASDVNIRYIRVRAEGTGDALGGRYNNDIMVDHVSASWSGDEVLSIYHGEDVTIQWSMITEACSTDHRFGGIWGNNYGTYHHNLIAHNDSRNPRWASGSKYNDYRNNVIYNWGYNSSYGGEAQQVGSPEFNFSTINMMANYYKAGPATESGVRDRIVEPSSRGDGDEGSWYVADNFVVDYPAVTANNWLGVDGSEYIQLNEPWPAMPINQQSAQDAYTAVLAHVGTSLPNRDSVDARIVQEVSTCTATYGDNGIISSPSDVGGWPVLNSDPAPDDDDHNGMPNDWELMHGLNPTLASDRNNDFDSDGYTNLEEYLNDIGAFPAVSTFQFNGGTSNRFAQAQNWAFDWQPSRFDTAVVNNNGAVVVDAVGQHAGNLVLATNPDDNVTFNITSGWLKVEDAPSGMSDGITMIGDDDAATAVLNLSGGKLTTKALLKGAGGSFNFTGGTLSADTVGFDLVNDGGTIAPGESPGVTQVLGNLTINAGTLAIELGGTTPGFDFDLLQVTGNATLAGGLDVSLLSGFVLSPDMTFEFLDITGTRTGQFAGLAEGALVGAFGEDLYITYTAGDGNNVALYTLAEIAGDFDGDGDVDGADFLKWQRGESPNPLSQTDLDAWKTNFGIPLATGANSTTVPEPNALVLLSLGAMLLLHCQRTAITVLNVRTCLIQLAVRTCDLG